MDASYTSRAKVFHDPHPEHLPDQSGEVKPQALQRYGTEAGYFNSAAIRNSSIARPI
jgi:hypothetical protein